VKSSTKQIFSILFIFFVLLCSSTGAQQITPQQNEALLKARQGSIVALPGFLSEKIPSLPYQKIILPGPQFLISDDPEYIRVPEAIVLQEAVQPGAVRLYVYNVNGIKEPEKMERKITAVIKNTGTQHMQLRMLRYSSQKPTANYFLASKKGLAGYFASSRQTKVRTIKPGEAVPIDEEMETYTVKYDELAHGIYEFVIDGPGEVSVIQTNPETTGPEALKKLTTVHPVNGKNAGRGLFGVSNYQILVGDTMTTDGEVKSLILADGKSDPWIVGTEGVTGQLSTLAGNYGVMYDVQLKWKSTNGKGLALVTWNARAGDNKWCGGMANAMVVSDGKFKGGIVELPSDSLRTRGAPEAILIQLFPPSKGGEVQTIHLRYSPPGASCLPTPLVFIPVDIK
jgi:hypothetical protein